MNPLVSVAIASYNNAPYIERCVNSVLKQSYSNLEILIVDDGSRDDTLSRIERYNDDRRIRILTKENGGLSSVRQMGLENAKGEYISFIDADDYLTPNYVELLLNKLTADGSDICLCSTRFEDMEGNYMAKESNILASKNSERPITVSIEAMSDPNEQFTSQFFLSDSWNKMYRTAFIRESGVVFNMPKGLNGTDTVFNRRIILRCPTYSKITEDVYIHVIYRSSAAHRKQKDLLGTAMFITSQLLEDIKELEVESLMAKRVSLFYYQRLLGAFADVYQENVGEKGLSKKMKTEWKRHMFFLKEHNIANIRICDVSSKEVQSFLIALKYSKSMLLPFYFWLHRLIFQ